MGLLIEKYIGKLGRKLFLLFCWLFTLLVIAAFADMVAGTFNAFGTDGALAEAAQTNGAAGTISLLFHRLRHDLRPAAEEPPPLRLEGSCGGPGVHRGRSGSGHDDAPDRQPGDLDLRHLVYIFFAAVLPSGC